MTATRRLGAGSLIVWLAACGSTNGEPEESDSQTAGTSQTSTTSAGLTDGSTSTTSGASSTETSGMSVGGTNTTSSTTGEQATASGGSTSTVGQGGMSSIASSAGGVTGAGGTASGGMGGTAGMGGSGTGGSGTGGSGTGQLSLGDPVPGFASVAGGTNGGGTDLSAAIRVSSMGELMSAVSGNAPAVVLVEPGEYRGGLSPGANKTIIGTQPGVTIIGYLKISGAQVSNIIVRNLAVRGERCNSYDECKAGDDAVYVGNGAHHVWLDHLDIADGQDGNLDVTQGGDYVTVSWTRFHYTYDKEHRFSNLIAGSDDEPASVGKLHITYMNSHWGERIDQRQPRGRFGNIHMLNNYHKTGGSQIHGVGVDMALIAENCVYDEGRSIWTDMGSPRGWKGIGNEGTGQDLNASRGSVFEVPYEYTALAASAVVAAVTSQDCGAGNTCTLSQ